MTPGSHHVHTKPEVKSDRDLLIEIHFSINGRGGVVDRVEKLEGSHTQIANLGGLVDRVSHLESGVTDLREFKIKWAATATLVAGAMTVAFNLIAVWIKSGH